MKAESHDPCGRQLRPALRIAMFVERAPSGVGDVVEVIAGDNSVRRITECCGGSFNDLLGKLNYVTRVEILVIAAILVFVVYIAYSLDLFKKDR